MPEKGPYQRERNGLRRPAASKQISASSGLPRKASKRPFMISPSASLGFRSNALPRCCSALSYSRRWSTWSIVFAVAAALQGVKFDRVLCLDECPVQDLGRCGGETTLCHLDECTIRMRHGIPGIESNRLLEHLKGLLIGSFRIAPKVGNTAQQAVVGSQAGCRPSQRLLEPCILNSPDQRRHDGLRDFVLHREDVIQTAIVALGPKYARRSPPRSAAR